MKKKNQVLLALDDELNENKKHDRWVKRGQWFTDITKFLKGRPTQKNEFYDFVLNMDECAS